MKQVCRQWNRVVKVDLGHNGHELKKMYRNWCQSRDEYDQRMLYYKAVECNNTRFYQLVITTSVLETSPTTFCAAFAHAGSWGHIEVAREIVRFASHLNDFYFWFAAGVSNAAHHRHFAFVNEFLPQLSDEDQQRVNIREWQLKANFY